MENRTCLTNERTPLSAMFPGSQKAFLSFFLMFAGESRISILLSSSEELILPPASPGTKITIYKRPRPLSKILIEINKKVQSSSICKHYFTHRIHKVNSFLVSQLRQVFLGESENFSLINTSKLSIHLEILFVQRLQSCKKIFIELSLRTQDLNKLITGVKQPSDHGVIYLFNNFSTSLLGIVLGDYRAKSVHIQSVFPNLDKNY